ncbi:MAG: M36 family metallopeptidase [Verrucomicrobiaceae bacterium]|nr:M36 family metallopeptidase [Verrucomicrobiaceae bacterium]
MKSPLCVRAFVLIAVVVFVASLWWWMGRGLNPDRSSALTTARREPMNHPPVTTPEDPVSATEVQAAAGAKHTHGRVESIDVRTEHRAAPALQADRAHALMRLTAEVPGVKVDFDPVTGAPSLVQATGRFLTPPAEPGANPRSLVEGYIDAHRDLFGHDAGALRTARVSREDVTQHSGMVTLVWNQQVNGIPVFKTIAKANITKKGEIISISDHFAGLPVPNRGEAVLSAERAIALAAASLDDVLPETEVRATTQPDGTEQRRRYAAPGQSDTTAQLTYLPMNTSDMRLGWDVTTMSLAQNEMFRMVVDAESGEVLFRTSLTADISDASYRIFTSDSPSPFSPGHDVPSSVQPPSVSRQLVTLQALNTTASPNGWINDGVTETLGNNVDAHTDTNADNVADLPRPTSATRVFDFAADLAQAPSTYKDAAVTNLFYWSNFFHDKTYELGFTESAGNFQTDNFGRGGLGNDAVQADAQDGSGTDNANFSTPADGSPGRMQMFLWTGPNPDRDGDFEMEVVLHELCHGLSNRLVGGGVGISSTVTQGMGEGWSDFYGLAFLAEASDNINGNWARGGWSRYLLGGTFTENYYYGGRRYPYTTNKLKNPLTFRDIDPAQQNVHAGIPRSPVVANTANQVHNMGNVWCVTLWDVRANLITKHGFATGNQLALQLVTDGMKLSPANPNFLQARDGIIQADLVNNAGANKAELWAAFAKRGMGVSASSPAATTTVGLVEAYDVPGLLAVTPTTAYDTIGVQGGPFSVTSRDYTLTNNDTVPVNWTAAKTQTWTTLSATSGTLAPGASTTITWSLNAGANALGVGEQTDTLTITNTTGNVTQQCPLSLVVNGSPVAQTITFPPLSPKLTSAAPFALTATATSGLPVTYAIVSGPATVSGSTVTLTGATGSVTIRASQSGSALYLPATDVLRSFVVGTNFQFAKVVAGSNGSNTFAIRADGTLWSWGITGSSGALADNTTDGRLTPTQVGTASNWAEVSQNGTSGLALRSDGTLWAWGLNLNGQLGDGTTSTKTAPTQIGIASWSKIAMGSAFSAAIQTNGTLWLSGSNTSGQLGDGTTTQRTSFAQIGTATNWVSVACGASHTLAVNSLGELWAWGANTSSQLGDGTTTASLVPVRIGTASDWASVAAVQSSSYAIKTTGTLWAWGLNSTGQLGDGTTTIKTIPTQIGTDTTWTQIVAGANNAAGRKSDGTLWIWGNNAGGQFGNGTTTSVFSPVQYGTTNDWTMITLGVNHATALRADGSMWTAGESNGGTTGVWPRALALAAANTSTWNQVTGMGFAFHAIRSDNTLWAFGTGSNGNLGTGSFSDARAPTQIGTLTDWKQVSEGTGSSALAVKTTGTLWAWGNNNSSQLGDGTTTTRSSPVQIGTATDWKQVAAGGSHTIAITTGGTLWAWGNNSSGQHGDGTTTSKTVPTQIGALTTWNKIAAGSSHCLAIKTDGTLWAWGLNSNGQLGDGSNTQRTTPVQVGTATNWTEIFCGFFHSLALRSDGTLWTWGLGTSGQLGSGATTSRNAPVQVGTDTNWAKITAGQNSTVAIKTDGSIWVCGQNNFGQCGLGTNTNVLSLTRIGTDTAYTSAAFGATSLAVMRQGAGFFTAGASAGPRTMAGGRDSRVLAPILPALAAQSFNALAASYSVYQSPVTVTTTSGLVPTVELVSGPATVSGNQITLTGAGTVVVTAYQYGDDAAWNAIPPMRFSFTVGNSLAVSFPTPGSTGLTSNGFNATNVVLNPTLGFAPGLGTILTLVNNTGSGPIVGTFPGVPQDGYITMSFGGVSYGFQVDYTGGDGNDIVLTHVIAPQTITVAQINPKLTTDAPFAIAASSSSLLPVSLSVVTGPATVSGSTVTLTGTAGSVTIKASQTGNALFLTAPDVLVTFAVGSGTMKFSQVSTGDTGVSSLAVGTDGTLWAWGLNSFSQIGDGTSTNRYVPVKIGVATNWFRVSAGFNHSLAVKSDGTLWAWGGNTSSQLGDGTTSTRSVPTQIGALTNWTNVAAGSSFSAGLKSDGTLWTWGVNTNGQLGQGDTTTRTTPTQVGTATDWASVYATQSHLLAIKTNGTLWACGLNSSGQLGLGDSTNRTSLTQVGTATNWKAAAGSLFTLAVRTDGTLWSWGSNSGGQLGDGSTTSRNLPAQVGTATDWNSVEAGNTHSIAVKTDGSLWSWGGNTFGQTGNGNMTSPQTLPLRVGTATDWATSVGGSSGTHALKTDGTLWAWGDCSGYSATSARGFARAMAFAPGTLVQVATGGTHNMFLKSDRSLWTWGANNVSQLGIGGTLNSDPVQVGTVTTWAQARPGNLYSGALRQDGSLWMWGNNGSNQLGDGTTTTRTTPVQIGAATDWAVLEPAAGTGSHTLALKSGGTLWAWGSNTSGQIGDGTTVTKTVPTQIGTDTDWSKIAAGSSHSLGLKTNGTVWAWGQNSFSQLGDGTTTQRTTPVQIGTDTSWARISASGTSSYAIKANGTLWSWGSNASGQLGLGDTTTRTTPTQVGTAVDWAQVSAGTNHAAAIKSDGSLWIWGQNIAGQLGDGASAQQNSPVRVGTSTGWVSVSCGQLHTVAVRDDGSVWTAGNNGSLRLTSASGRSPYIGAPVVPALSAQTLNVTPVGTNPYRFTASSGLPVSLSLVSGSATIAGDEVTLTGPSGSSVEVLAWQPGDDSAWNATGPVSILLAKVDPPVVVSASHSSITGGGATLGATVNPNGGATSVLFQYGTSPTLATSTNTGGQNIGSGTSNVAATPVAITGLTPLTTYYYRAVATNGGGSTNGTIQSFTTLGPDIGVEQPSGTPLTGGVSSVSFASTNLGASSAALTFTIRSTVAGATLNLGAISLGGTGANDFTLNTAGMSSTIAGGGSSTFTVTFTPFLAGARAATLSIPSNDADENPFLVTLSGTGVAVPGPTQTIVGPATLAPRFLADGSFSLAFGATSGLPLTWQIVGGTAATLSGGVFTPVSAGAVTVRISQGGGGGYNAAADVYRTLLIADGKFAKLAAGCTSSHGLGIKTDGSLWAWGLNNSGQLGNGATTNSNALVHVGTAMDWTDVAAGNTFSVGIRAGTLWTWGLNSSGQLGQGDTTQRTTPTQVGTASDWVAVAASTTNAFAIKSDGTLWAWGSNTSSQLGDGTTTQRNSPVQIGTATNWTAVACGNPHTIARRADGTLWAWGPNSTGQLGVGDTTARTTPTQIGTGTTWSNAIGCASSSSWAIQTNGTLWAWGQNNALLGDGSGTQRNSPVQIGAATNWTRIQGGSTQALGTRADGSLWRFGSATSSGGGFGSGTSSTTPVRIGTDPDWSTAVCGTNHSAALKTDGTLWTTTGNGSSGQLAYPHPNFVPIVSGGVSVAATATSHTHFIRPDGTLWGVSTNAGLGDFGDGTSTRRPLPVQIGAATNWADVSGGTSHSLALRADGTLWATGINSSGQLGDGTTTSKSVFTQIGTASWQKIFASFSFSAGVRADGTLWTWGTNTSGQLGLGDTALRLSPTQVGTDTNWADVSCGNSHMIALKTDGTLWAWGSNGSGEVGDGTNTQRATPVQVGTAADWSAIAASNLFSVARKTNGTLWTWGSNTSGQLGLGDTTNRLTPTQISAETDWVQISAASGVLIALKPNGTLWACGSNGNGQLGDGTTTSRSTLQQVGTHDSWTEIGRPTIATNLVAITADGTLWGLGNNGDLQLSSAARVNSEFDYAHPAIGTQTISFPAVTITGYNTPITLNATASSGLPVSYFVSGPASVSGNQFTVTGPGTVKLLAYQAGERPAWHNAPVEQATILFPDIAVEQPAGSPLTDGAATVDIGSAAVAVAVSKTFTLKNTGTATLNIAGGSINGSHAADFVLGALPATVSVGGNTTFTVTFTPAASGARSAALHINCDDPDESPFDINLTGYGLTPYQTAQQNAGITGTADPNGDADGDGVSNVMEVAFGTNPGAGGSGSGALQHTGGFGGGGVITNTGQPIVEQQPAPNTVDVRAVFVRRKDAAPLGLGYTVQFSADLGTWQSSTATPTVLADDGTYQIVSVPYPFFVGKKKARFFRVVVSLAP